MSFLAPLTGLFLVNKHEIWTNKNSYSCVVFDMRSCHNRSDDGKRRLSKPVCHWTLKHNTVFCFFHPLLIVLHSFFSICYFFKISCPVFLSQCQEFRTNPDSVRALLYITIIKARVLTKL